MKKPTTDALTNITKLTVGYRKELISPNTISAKLVSPPLLTELLLG